MSIPATALAVLVASSQRSSTVSAFAPSATVAPLDSLTSRNFRHIDDSEYSMPSNIPADHHLEENSTSKNEPQHRSLSHQDEHDESSCTISSFSMSSAPLSYFSTNEQMPTWLRPCGSLAENKLCSLRKYMINSYLSQLEAERVISSIKEASAGDLNKMAGAADFCQLIVEKMEMGATTLIAAAFHYCDCFTAREQSTGANSHPSLSFSASEYWDQIVHEENTERQFKYGIDAIKIAKDAANLKRTEMLASQSLKTKPSGKDAENMRKMLLSETSDWRALAIRSAGCLYRLRGIYEERDCSRDKVVSPNDIRVAHEALLIYSPLASRLGMHRLKNEIEGAAFRVLYRRQFDEVTSLTQETTPRENDDSCLISTLNEGMETIIDLVTERVEEILKEDEDFIEHIENFKVTGRIKEPYSLWKKMLKMKANRVLDVPDSLALRIVLEAKKKGPNEDSELTSAKERALCYHAQSICTKNFKPLKSGRFKDYIANPKPNGYQSLHYTASTEFDGREWPFEIQIRSSEMHQVAEFGLAAHWDYKEKGRVNQKRRDTKNRGKTPHFAFNLDQSSDAYLRSVQYWHWQHAHGKSSWKPDTSVRKGSSKQNNTEFERSQRRRERDERLEPYLKALMADQTDLTREQVFIFLESQEDGTTLALPAGSCVLDAIRESERTLGFTPASNIKKKIEHNGSLASVNRKLRNGDILTIPY